MTLTANFSAELRSLVMGPGTNYPIVSPIDGLFSVPLLSDDLVADDRVSPGPDRLGGRVLSWRVAVVSDDDEDDHAESVSLLLSELVTAWRRASSDVALDVLIPGPSWPRRFYGRPRLPGSGVSTDRLAQAHAELDVVFVCSDPLGYGDAVVAASDGGVSTIAADDAGDVGADSPRVIMTVVGSGGTPSITHAPSGAVVTFAAALPDAHVAVIDCLTGAVTVQAVAAPDALTAASVLPRLAGGVGNTFTVANATSLSVSARPGFW
jgi:hypothetical protein